MEKVWLRGVPGRGDDVIDMLKEFGGKPSPIITAPHFAGNPRHVLYINHDGIIDFEPETSELAKVIMDCYTHIGLPARKGPYWCDGTILIRQAILSTEFAEGRGDDFAIFKAVENDESLFTAYAELDVYNKIYEGSILPTADYRPAAPEETKEFVNRIMAMGKFWNPWTKKMEDLKQVK